MVYDGICCYRIVEELQNIIGYKIDKVSEPNKNTIILDLYKAGNNLSLLSCISSANYRLHLTRHSFANPVSAPNFCMLLRKHLIGFKISKIYTPDLERIVFIDFENYDNPNKPIFKKLIVELMGKHSNIILTDENSIILDSIRHTSTEEHSQRDIYPTCRYVLPQTKKYNFLNVNSKEEFYAILKTYFENDITLTDLICNKFNGFSKSFVNSIINEYNSFSKGNIFNLYDKILETIHLHFNDYTLNYSLDDFYFNKENNELFKIYKDKIYNLVTHSLKKEQKKIDNINKKLSECTEMDKYRLWGELLTTNLYKFSNSKVHINEITVENYYDNNSFITIPLDTRYSPSYNAKRYFKKYTKLKNALDIVTIQKNQTLNEIDYIESVLYEIENCSTIKDLDYINQELSEIDLFKTKQSHKNSTNKKIKNRKPSKANSISFHPLEFTIEDYKVYVGRNNKENDYLTTKFAKKDDIWFHTKDIHGSHVILKTHPNEIVPDNILLKVAKLAATHSKAKNSSNVLVDYCPVSYVKKPNNSKPGFVIYKNNKTIKCN
ncbi:MAG: fibronectin/fibrinogen-binding protein [Clostridia bacterium]|nr:fibronectin/fibrinogen-binding protein [Clostridia bacterium]